MSIEKSYKQLETELQELLARVDTADYDEIEALIADYEQGMKLIKLLETRLTTAKNKITKIKLKEK